MLIAIFLMALVVISLAIAAPQVAKSIQRDRDLETFHQGMQYRRAIKLYFVKFHAYPPNVDALVETNNIRFLRKQYVDPITNKADWKPILFGQNKTPTAMGFFGEPLAGGATSIAGTGTGGGNGGGGAGGVVMPPGIFGSSTTSSPTDNSGGASGNGSSSSSTSSDQSGQTFGGAGIIGFEPASPKKSILIYKKKDHYNEWEFTYDPLSEAKTISSSSIGQPASSTSTPVGSPSPTASTSTSQ